MRKIIVMIALAMIASTAIAQQDAATSVPAPPAAPEVLEKQRALEEAERKLAEAAREVAQLSQSMNEARSINNQVFVFDSNELASDDTPMLGVTLSSSRVSKRVNGREVMNDDDAKQGVAIVGVGEDSGAEKAGLQAGDRLISVDGVSLLGDSDGVPIGLISGALEDRKPGDVVAVELLRDGKRLTKQVALSARSARGLVPGANGFVFSTPGENNVVSIERHLFDAPMAPQAPGVTNLKRFFNGSGQSFVFGAGRRWADMELVELSPSLGAYFGADEGLLVVRAPEDEALGFEDGDVIRMIGDRAPESVGHAMRILSSYEPGEQMNVEIMRKRKKRTLDITLPE
ncbi:MAG: PDZ domain-containing protein [Pseudomonadota bacterium]